MTKTLRRTSRSPPEANARTKEAWGPEALSTYRSLPEDTLSRREGKASWGRGRSNLPLPRCSWAVSPDSSGK